MSLGRAGGRPGILLDRDGTIIVDHGYVGSIARVDFIEGSPEAIAAFNRAGIPVAVITNQSGVARGFYGVEDVQTVHRHIAERLADYGAHVDLFVFCPYHPDGTVEGFVEHSPDRKPGPGMALAAAQELDLDLASSWVVGDRAEDMGLAAAIGASGIFLDPNGPGGPGGPDDGEHPGVPSFPNLAAAAGFILDRIETVNPPDKASAPAALAEPTAPAGPTAPAPAPAAPAGPAPAAAAPAAVTPKFPTTPIEKPAAYCLDYFAEAERARRTIDLAQVDRAVALLVEAYSRDAVVFACGNGGSASVANHLQCDLVKGIRNATDLWPRAQSLSTNVELMTAIANDNGYADVFAYQLQSQARPGDVLMSISSSGRSENIVRAMRWAKENGLRTIALTGFGGGEASALADVSLHVDCTNYGIVEDTHQAIMHLMAQFIRQSHMSPEAVAFNTF